jgi:hypothetical protein
MPAVPFTRPTIIAAVALIDRSLSQASFNHLVLRLGLENEITSDTAISVSKKADKLGRIVVQRPADPERRWKVRCHLPKQSFVRLSR